MADEAPAETPAPRRRRFIEHPLARRLPLLLAIAVGLWLWRSGEESERTLIWRLPGDRATVERVEIQLMDDDGSVLRRETLYYQTGAPPEITQRYRIDEGSYQARLFITRRGEPPQVLEVPVVVQGEEIIPSL